MRRRLTALAVALLSLAGLAVARGGGGGGPPLYDGICLAPAYKLLGHTPPPSSGSMVFTAADLLSQTGNVADDQLAPQAQVIFGSGTFAPAHGASSVTVSLSAVTPPATHPDGTINGNVYDFAATSGGSPVPVAPGHPVTVALGSTASGLSTLTLEHLVGGRWTALRTFPSGCGSTFHAASPSLGLFALVARNGSGSGGGGSTSGGSGAPVVAIVAVVVVLLALVIVAARLSRRRR